MKEVLVVDSPSPTTLMGTTVIVKLLSKKKRLERESILNNRITSHRTKPLSHQNLLTNQRYKHAFIVV